MEMNNHIELEDELQPMGLPLGQEFGGGEVLKVLVVCDNIDQFSWAFKVVAPWLKWLMDSEEFLVMGVIVQFWGQQSLRVVGDRPNLFVSAINQENANNGIVEGISPYNHWSVRNPMDEDGGRSKGFFQLLKGGTIGVSERPWDTFASQVS